VPFFFFIILPEILRATKNLQAPNFLTFWLPLLYSRKTIRHYRMKSLSAHSPFLKLQLLENTRKTLGDVNFSCTNLSGPLYLCIYHLVICILTVYLTHATELACLPTTVSLEKMSNPEFSLWKKK